MDSAVAIAEPPEAAATRALIEPPLRRTSGTAGNFVFLAILAGGLGYVALNLKRDLAGTAALSAWTWALLAAALGVAFAFHFVNGFHDTANAVATVIYTHSLPPGVAVVWSGIWNLIGVLVSSGAVAFAILALLPVETILQSGSRTGFCILFSLLIAALVWNVSTWWLGLPVSSSHTLIGSIIGVGLANQFLGPHAAVSGVDWDQAISVLKVLLISPIVGFGGAALLLLVLKACVRKPELYESPKDGETPPLWIRGLLVLTCTGVSFGHGSNDGQKGMGLIMLILIGAVPAVYTLNHAMGPEQMRHFAAVSQQTEQILETGSLQTHTLAAGIADPDPHIALARFIHTRQLTPDTAPALAAMVRSIAQQTQPYSALAGVPASDQATLRRDMYVTSEALHLLPNAQSSAQSSAAHREFTRGQLAVLDDYRRQLDQATQFIPIWVKVAVALALGLGTMVGWRRIVITVGEKIGKQHLTYAQGAVAEIVAAITIIGVNMPVSTTHVLSSGVAGTMAANGSGLRRATIRNIALAWVLTLPAAGLLAAAIFWAMRLFV